MSLLSEPYTVIQDERMEWGALYMPANDVNQSRTDKGLRVLAMGSTYPGYLLLNAIKRMEVKHPDKINLVGFYTDDATNPKARISMAKRVWRYYTNNETNYLVKLIQNDVLAFGAPCYTGNIKTDFFRAWLNVWAPDVIIVCGLGQRIDQAIIDMPTYGIYNFHPSDLSHNLGAGPQPYENAMESKMSFTRLTLHHVTPTIDAGSVVGQSSPIRITNHKGGYPDDKRLLHDKATAATGWMTIELLKQILENEQQGLEGPIASFDFEDTFPKLIKNQLTDPINEYDTKRFQISEMLQYF